MESKCEYLIKKHFWFLVDEFGLTNSEGIFTSDNVEINITCSRDMPEIAIRPLSEPEFTSLPIDWILDYFTNSEFSKTFIRQFGELEENIKTFANVFKRFSKRLLFDSENWWIPAHQHRIDQWEALYGGKPLDAFREIYEYLNGKK